MPLRTRLRRMDLPKTNSQPQVDSPRMSSLAIEQPRPAVDPPQMSPDSNIPASFICPISLCLMEDPVTLPSGITYDRSSVQKWLREGNRTCPVSMSNIGSNPALIPNHALRALILDWQSQQSRTHQQPQASRIPETALIRSAIDCIAQGTPHRLPALKRLKSMLQSGEVSQAAAHREGLAAALVAILSSESAASDGEAMEMVATLALLRVGRGELATLGRSEAGMRAVGRLLREGSEETAGMVERMAREGEIRVEEGGVVRGLMGMVVGGGKTAVAAMAAMGAGDGKGREEVVRGVEEVEGVAAALVEMLAGAERSRAEKLLTLISRVCLCSHQGRAAVAGHALAIPVLVRSLLVYSDLANELAVSILWSLICCNTTTTSTPPLISAPTTRSTTSASTTTTTTSTAIVASASASASVASGNRAQPHSQPPPPPSPRPHLPPLPLDDHSSSPAIQASQLGATKKLLVLAQMDCTSPTKRRITDLLKHLSRLQDQHCPHSQLLHYDSSAQHQLLLL